MATRFLRLFIGFFLWWPLIGQAAITHVGFSEENSSGKVRELILDKPAGVVAGDLMIALVVQDKKGTISAPAGWTALMTSGNQEPRLSVFWKQVEAGEPAAHRFTSTVNEEATGGIAAFRGVDPASPIVASALLADGSNDTSMPTPSLTPGVADTMLVAVWGTESAELAPPGSMTQSVGLTVGKGKKAVSALMAYQPWASRAATGTRTATLSKKSRGNAGLVALRPFVPVLSITAPSAAAEGNTGTRTLLFSASLSTMADAAVTATYSLVDGTATGGTSCAPGVDYIRTGGTVNIAMGATSATIAVTICGDAVAEGDETFSLSLSNPVNAVLGTDLAIGTIVDDDFIAEWRMDEAFWNGTPNEVLDSSGNGHHGTAAVANGATLKPTTADATPAYASGGQSTCRYGQFDTPVTPVRSFGTVVASSIPTLPSSFTFSAWIRSTQPSQSGQRILVRDDAQNGWGFSLGDPGSAKVRFFNRNIRNTGSVAGDGSNPNCGVFCLDTAAVITANEWFFVAVAIDTVAKRITHYVYNRAGALVSNTSSAYSGTWADGSGVLAIGGETAASAEGRLASFHFRGNIDEVRISFGALTRERIESILTRTRPCAPAIDHFELNFASPGLTCLPSEVTVRACADAACSTLYTGSVTAALEPTGWVGGGLITFSGGSARQEFRRTTAGSVTLGVTSATPAASGATRCRVNGLAASTQCNLVFDDSGFALEVPDLIAYKPSGTVKLRAVKKSDTSTRCVPAFADVTREVAFHTTYIDPGPSGRPVSRSLTINGEGISGSGAAPTSLALAFDGNGEADLQIQYPDAGQMQLDVRYSGSEASGDPSLVLQGNDTFLSRPAGLCVSTTSNCASGDASCPPFARAGHTFDLSIKAVGWESDSDPDLCTGSNGDTPNYAQADIPLTLGLVSPVSGSLGTLVPTRYTHRVAVDATTRVPVALSEVGVFTVTAVPPAYGGYALPPSTSASIGRIVPDHFVLSTADAGVLAAACTTVAPFAYSGQDLSWLVAPQVDIGARSAFGNTTLNYTASGYARLTIAGVEIVAPGQDSVAVGMNGSPLAVDLTRGAAQLEVTGPGEFRYRWNPADRITYRKEPSARVSPFAPTLSWQVTRVIDTDGVSAVDMPLVFDSLAPFELRYGRLRLENAFGPETADLVLPMRAEYWDGSAWRLNADESCWSFDTQSEATLTPGTLSAVVPNDPVVAWFAGGLPPAGKPLLLSAPGSGRTGVETVNYAVPVYLRHDWDGDGADDDAPSATATFGQYRGHDRIIFWREVSP